MTDINQPVRNAQVYLRRISYLYPAIPSVIPDGVYGEQTKEAVEAFQREFGIAVSGEIDKETWDKMIEVYSEVEKNLAAPRKVDIFPSPTHVLAVGSVGATVTIVQAMISALSEVFANLPDVVPNGIYNTETAAAVTKIQEVSALDASGATDKATWEMLSTLYEFHVAKSRTHPIDRKNKYVIR